MLPDALLIERIAALGDRSALADLDTRYGMTLYAVAYTLLLDAEAADTVVAAAFREVWRGAASFNHRHGSVRRWLGDLTRRAASERMRGSRLPRDDRLASRRLPAARTHADPRRRRWTVALARLARLVPFAALLALRAVLVGPAL